MSAAATESHGENLEDRKREQELQAAIKAGETAVNTFFGMCRAL